MSNPEVVFLRVTDPQVKLRRLCDVVKELFSKRLRVLVLAPDEKAMQFVDKLLWSDPADSFLPHSSGNVDSQEKIHVCSESKNFNSADVCVNLCTLVPSMADEFKQIVELRDETSQERLDFARQRWMAYQKSGYSLSQA